MKKVTLIISMISCFALQASDKIAESIPELNALVKSAKPGDRIFLKDGTYKDAVIKFNGEGSENALITIAAQHPGKVLLEGNSSISFSGKYLHIKDFVFQKGGAELKNKQVIEFRTSDKEQASHCMVSGCVIDSYNNSIKTDVNTWVGIYGEYNLVEKCLFKAKDNMGPTLVVWLDSGRAAHHTIFENYFLTRENGAKVDNGLESIRIGDSKTSFTDAHCVVAFNRFEECNGEIEIISNKSCHNSYLHNTFYNSDGGLTLRHGNHTLCDGNYFDGGKKKLSYGIRFIGEGQVAINNYFYNLHGGVKEMYRSPISVLNGLVNTPINGYYPVKNAVIADNIFFDCEGPAIRIGAFSPKREGMSIAPDSITITDNLFLNRLYPATNVLQIITPASHLISANNKISRYTAAAGFEEYHWSGKFANIGQDRIKTIQYNNKNAGANEVLSGITKRTENIKYTYSSPNEVGPVWLRKL